MPALYLAAASVILIVLAVFRASTTWPRFAIVAAGVPVYALLRRTSAAVAGRDTT